MSCSPHWLASAWRAATGSLWRLWRHVSQGQSLRACWSTFCQSLQPPLRTTASLRGVHTVPVRSCYTIGNACLSGKSSTAARKAMLLPFTRIFAGMVIGQRLVCVRPFMAVFAATHFTLLHLRADADCRTSKAGRSKGWCCWLGNQLHHSHVLGGSVLSGLD